MRSVSFKSVLLGAARMGGIDPESGQWDLATAKGVCELVNQRVREGWTWGWWPEWLHTEERTPVDGLIVWAQAGERVIGSLKEIYRTNPNLTRGARALNYRLDQDGIFLVGAGVPDSVWCVFRPPEPVFVVDEWAATTAYVTGSLVYVAALGDCFEALQGSTGETPGDGSAFWQRVLFPAALAVFVKRAVYADMLRDEGQQEKALAEESRAEKRLLDEYDVASCQQGVARGVRVAAY